MLAFILAAAVATIPAPVNGDFDRDGQADVAVVVAAGVGYDLVVRPGGVGRADIKIISLKDPASLYVRKVESSKGDVLDFGTPEASRAVALWDGKAFEVIWLAD